MGENGIDFSWAEPLPQTPHPDNVNLVRVKSPRRTVIPSSELFPDACHTLHRIYWDSMSLTKPFSITKVEVCPLDIPVTDPFVVATGQVVTAQNLFVRVTLGNGSQGYGEIAPFPDLSGEDQKSSFVAVQELAAPLLGQSALHYRHFAKLFQEMAPAHPATRCGLETALVDAVCHAAGIPLWAWWGGAEVRERETDITIPITDVDRTLFLRVNGMNGVFGHSK